MNAPAAPLPAEGAPADRPPEARGLPRDGVRLMIATPAGIGHTRFADLGRELHPGDLLVVNNSGTLPAALPARREGRPVVVHVAGAPGPAGPLVEVRPPGPATGPVRDLRPGEQLELPGGARLVLVRPFPGGSAPTARLWRARLDPPGGLAALLARHGRPISYPYVPRRWPLSAYQTVFAREPGSAEMPSAGRPFTAALVTELVSAGVIIAPVTLHAGVSSLEAGETPAPEAYRVPPATAQLVRAVRRSGGRVIAVGTTVTRALETVAGPGDTVRPGSGWTDLVLGPDRPARVVDGLITGWHGAGASHLRLLEACAGSELVARAYRVAVESGYLWHEFGDSCLLLPERPRTIRKGHGLRGGQDAR